MAQRSCRLRTAFRCKCVSLVRHIFPLGQCFAVLVARILKMHIILGDPLFSGGTFVSVKSWRKACLLSVLLSLMRSDSCFILAGVHPSLPFFVLCVFGVQPIVIAVLRSDRKLRDVQNNLNPSACDVPAQYCFTLSSVLILRGKPNVDTRCLWFHYMKLPFWFFFFLKDSLLDILLYGEQIMHLICIKKPH